VVVVVAVVLDEGVPVAPSSSPEHAAARSATTDASAKAVARTRERLSTPTTLTGARGAPTVTRELTGSDFIVFSW